MALLSSEQADSSKSQLACLQLAPLQHVSEYLHGLSKMDALQSVGLPWVELEHDQQFFTVMLLVISPYKAKEKVLGTS